MSAIEVTTQAQLDNALENLADEDWIVCLGGTWDSPLCVSGSATVMASDSATVRAYGSATVMASDSATVRAYDSATVRASDSATVMAYDSATVRAYGSATVMAYDSTSVEASKSVSVHRHGTTPTVTGGVIIEVPDPAQLDATGWCDFYGVTVSRGFAFLYKAVDGDYSTKNARRHGIVYTPGTKVTCTDWDPEPVCGGGLHVSPRPFLAAQYNTAATRYVQVKVKIADLVVIGDKAKTPRLTVVCECDDDGELIIEAVAA